MASESNAPQGDNKFSSDKEFSYSQNAANSGPVPPNWIISLPTGTVTFLFTDIEGSTPRWERQPEKMAVALEVHNATLRYAIQANGGCIFKFIGDEYQAAFPTAPQGLQAAIDAQQGLSSAPWNEVGPLKVRMGLHTGEANLDPQGDEYAVSHTFNRAGRVRDAAHGGQILLSQEAADLVERSLPEGVLLRDLGNHRLKGLSYPEHLFQVVIPGLQVDFPPLRTLDTCPNNLPVQLTSFIGREVDMADIGNLLQKSRLVTLTGTGGTGKTRLALQSAANLLERFSDGVWLVEFSPISDPELLTQTVANALGMHLSAGPHTLSFLVDYLKPKHLLLIFDNCEHLIAACALLVDALLRACSHISILVSSREVLGIEGEAHFPVPPLRMPNIKQLPSLDELAQFEAIRLFIERARTISPAFVLSAANASAVVQVCHRLDGIPLAIELAAARISVLRVEEIALRLDDRFRLLTGGSRTALPRQQTLRASIDWSYELLSEAERVLLQRLSVFASGWTLEAAEDVCSGDGIEACNVLDLLGQMVNKSLVTVDAGDGNETRFRMLETIWQYANEKLVEAGKAAEARSRYLQYFVELAEKMEGKIRGPDQAVILNRLETELENIRLALEWSLEGMDKAYFGIDCGLRLASALEWFWHLRIRHLEGSKWLNRLLSLEKKEYIVDRLMDTKCRILRAKALLVTANLAYLSGEHKQAKECAMESQIIFEQLGQEGRSGYAKARYFYFGNDISRSLELEVCLEIFKETGDFFNVGECLLRLGHIVKYHQDYEQARRYYEECLTVKEEIGDQDGIAAALMFLGEIALIQNNPERARSLLNESRAYLYRLNDLFSLILSGYFLGYLDWELGNYTDAVKDFYDVLSMARQQGDSYEISFALSNLGRLALSQGDWDQAAQWFSENLAFTRAYDVKTSLAYSLLDLGNLAFEENNLEKATKLYSEALGICIKNLDEDGKASTLYDLGRVAYARGDYQMAREHLVEAIGLQPYANAIWITIFGGRSATCPMEALAFLAAAEQHIVQATYLLGATEAWHQKNLYIRTPRERSMREHALKETRAMLDEVAFSVAWEQGKVMTLQQAIAFAKGDIFV